MVVKTIWGAGKRQGSIKSDPERSVFIISFYTCIVDMNVETHLKISYQSNFINPFILYFKSEKKNKDS